jgi:hypothetical protein
MAFWTDLVGTVSGYVRLGLTGVRLKNSSGNLAIRDAADTGDAEVTAAKVNISGDSLALNTDAAGSGDDFSYTLQRPLTGMTAPVALTLPIDDGTAGYAMVTDGDGNLSWAAAGNTAMCATVDTTTVAFGASSPVTMFTLPANAVIDEVEVVIDTAFNGTAPQLSVGIVGTTAKYMGATGNDLKAAAGTRYVSHPNEPAVGTTEAIIATYAADSSSAGSARVLVTYSVPA